MKSDKEKGKIMHLDQIVGQTNKYSQLQGKFHPVFQ